MHWITLLCVFLAFKFLNGAHISVFRNIEQSVQEYKKNWELSQLETRSTNPEWTTKQAPDASTAWNRIASSENQPLVHSRNPCNSLDDKEKRCKRLATFEDQNDILLAQHNPRQALKLSRRETLSNENKRKRCDICKQSTRCKKLGKCEYCQKVCQGLEDDVAPVVSKMEEIEGDLTRTAEKMDQDTIVSSVYTNPIQVPQNYYTIGEFGPGPKQDLLTRLLGVSKKNFDRLLVLAKRLSKDGVGNSDKLVFFDTAQVFNQNGSDKKNLDVEVHKVDRNSANDKDLDFISAINKAIALAKERKMTTAGTDSLNPEEIDGIIKLALSKEYSDQESVIVSTPNEPAQTVETTSGDELKNNISNQDAKLNEKTSITNSNVEDQTPMSPTVHESNNQPEARNTDGDNSKYQQPINQLQEVQEPTNYNPYPVEEPPNYGPLPPANTFENNAQESEQYQEPPPQPNSKPYTNNVVPLEPPQEYKPQEAPAQANANQYSPIVIPNQTPTNNAISLHENKSPLPESANQYMKPLPQAQYNPGEQIIVYPASEDDLSGEYVPDVTIPIEKPYEQSSRFAETSGLEDLGNVVLGSHGPQTEETPGDLENHSPSEISTNPKPSDIIGNSPVVVDITTPKIPAVHQSPQHIKQNHGPHNSIGANTIHTLVDDLAKVPEYLFNRTIEVANRLNSERLHTGLSSNVINPVHSNTIGTDGINDQNSVGVPNLTDGQAVIEGNTIDLNNGTKQPAKSMNTGEGVLGSTNAEPQTVIASSASNQENGAKYPEKSLNTGEKVVALGPGNSEPLTDIASGASNQENGMKLPEEFRNPGVELVSMDVKNSADPLTQTPKDQIKSQTEAQNKVGPSKEDYETSSKASATSNHTNLKKAQQPAQIETTSVKNNEKIEHVSKSQESSTPETDVTVGCSKEEDAIVPVYPVQGANGYKHSETEDEHSDETVEQKPLLPETTNAKNSSENVGCSEERGDETPLYPVNSGDGYRSSNTDIEKPLNHIPTVKELLNRYATKLPSLPTHEKKAVIEDDSENKATEVQTNEDISPSVVKQNHVKGPSSAFPIIEPSEAGKMPNRSDLDFHEGDGEVLNVHQEVTDDGRSRPSLVQNLNGFSVEPQLPVLPALNQRFNEVGDIEAGDTLDPVLGRKPNVLPNTEVVGASFDWQPSSDPHSIKVPEVSSKFAKLVPAGKMNKPSGHGGSQMIFLGDMALPLNVKETKDGSYLLSVDFDKMCNCKEKQCPRERSIQGGETESTSVPQATPISEPLSGTTVAVGVSPRTSIEAGKPDEAAQKLPLKTQKHPRKVRSKLFKKNVRKTRSADSVKVLNQIDVRTNSEETDHVSPIKRPTYNARYSADYSIDDKINMVNNNMRQYYARRKYLDERYDKKNKLYLKNAEEEGFVQRRVELLTDVLSWMKTLVKTNGKNN